MGTTGSRSLCIKLVRFTLEVKVCCYEDEFDKLRMRYADPLTRYMEMDINVHSFKYYVRRAFWSLKDLVPKMMLRIAFVIQAERDEEMPETIFGAASFANILYDDATPVELA